jgi:hypothetical protein
MEMLKLSMAFRKSHQNGCIPSSVSWPILVPVGALANQVLVDWYQLF